MSSKSITSKFITVVVCHYFSKKSEDPKISQVFELLEDMVREYPDFLIVRSDIEYTGDTIPTDYDIAIYNVRGILHILISGDAVLHHVVNKYYIILHLEKIISLFYARAKVMTISI